MAQSDALKIFSVRRVLIPVVLGLAGASYLLYATFDPSALEQINWTYRTIVWLFVALLMMAIRDVAYMYRIRVLTDNKISWRNSFDVIMLWEFASALTPSVVGGSSIALYIVHKEGVSVGRSTSVVMVTALMDELFYIIMVPIILLITGMSNLFPVALEKEFFGITFGTKGLFLLGYVFIIFLTSMIVYGILINPRGFKAIILSVFKIRFLRKWRYRGIQVGNDIITASKEFRSKPFSFWAKAFGATFFSWTARYWVVNFLILAFLTVDDHLLIYARQLVMWVIMLISPTPGSSGVAELAFSGFLGEFTLGLGAALALLWRLFSYYPYLFIGAVVLPNWLKRTHGTQQQEN